MFETKELLTLSEFLVIESLWLIPQFYYAWDGGYSVVDVENPWSTALDESPVRCNSMFGALRIFLSFSKPPIDKHITAFTSGIRF